MNLFTIKDLEKLSGIKAHTIRIWEQRYSLIKPNRTDSNIRYYSNEELKKLLNIALLNKYGYKISHIDRMGSEEIHKKILTLSNEEAKLERVINDLIQNMIDLNTSKFENVLDSYISTKGIEKTIQTLIFPFLNRIGILWLTNHINPAQEHIVSNIIRQKLIVGIDRTVTHIKTDKKVLLFMPEAEYHELGLLYVHYLLKYRGVEVLYVGANIPLKDLDQITSIAKPDFLYSHLTTVASNFNFEKFLRNISVAIPQVPVIISGKIAQDYKEKTFLNISLMKNLKEVFDFVESI